MMKTFIDRIKFKLINVSNNAIIYYKKKPREDVEKNLINAILIGVLVIFYFYIGYATHHATLSFDYRIYEYFSQLYFSGENPYFAESIPWTDINKSFTDPQYLDYTGLQLMIYNTAYLVSQHSAYNGFVLLSLVIMFLSILTVFALIRRKIISIQVGLCLYVLMFSPYLWYVLFERSYEDKTLFFLLPLAIVLAFKWSPKATAAFLGVITGWIGVGVFLLPLILIDAAKQSGKILEKIRVITPYIIIFLVFVIISLVPFFPESLTGWERRSALEGTKNPLWFSIWNLVALIYFAGLNKIAVVVSSISIYYFRYKEYISFRAATVLMCTLPVFFSINTPAQRITPVICAFVFAFSLDKYAKLYTLIASIILLLFFYVDKYLGLFQTYPSDGAIWKSLFLYSPIILGLFLLHFDSKCYRHKQAHNM